jgi:hypothetical protein
VRSHASALPASCALACPLVQINDMTTTAMIVRTERQSRVWTAAVASLLQPGWREPDRENALTGAPAWRIRKGDWTMLETIAIILIVLWLLGMVSGYTMGNFIYILLVIAIVLFLVRLVSGRRVV